jgi:hypothetical protein
MFGKLQESAAMAITVPEINRDDRNAHRWIDPLRPFHSGRVLCIEILLATPYRSGANLPARRAAPGNSSMSAIP